MSEIPKGKAIVNQWFADTMAGKFNDVVGHSSHEWEALEKRIDAALATLTSRWTDKLPTAGKWWWRANAHHGEHYTKFIMKVYPVGDRFLCRSTETFAARIDEIGGQWSSQPIKEPEE